jgi:hypothetical protein
MILKFCDPEGLGKWVGQPQEFEVDLLDGIDNVADVDGRGPVDLRNLMDRAIVQHARSGSSTHYFSADESIVEMFKDQAIFYGADVRPSTADSYRGVRIKQ